MTATEQRPTLGIVTIPKELWQEGYNKKFFEDWEEDPYGAFTNIYNFKYIGFSQSGMGAEYWTPMSDLPEVVDKQQLAEVVVRWLSSNATNPHSTPLTNYAVLQDCFYYQHEIVWNWCLDNASQLLCIWSEMRKNNLLAKYPLYDNLSVLLINSASCSDRAGNKAEFFAKCWAEYGDECNFSVFSVAYFRNGKWQEEAYREVHKYAKKLRRRLKARIDGYYSCKRLIKKRPHWLPKAIEELREDLFKDLKFFIHNMLIREHPELKHSAEIWKRAEKRAKHYRVDLPFPI